MRAQWPWVVAVMIVGCTSEVPEPADFFFPQHGSPLGTGDLALLEGTLVAADGCLWIEAGDGSRHLVIWPSDTGRGMINGQPAVLGPGNELLAETGSHTMLGGSGTDAGTALRLAGEIPAACAGESFWVASTVESRP